MNCGLVGGLVLRCSWHLEVSLQSGQQLLRALYTVGAKVCRRTIGTVVITQWNFGVEFRGVEKWSSYFVVPGWYKSQMVHLSFQ